MTNVGYDPTSQELFATLEHGSWYSKTCQVSLLPGDLALYSETFPKWGSMRNTELYQRPAWVPAIGGRGFSSSRGRWDTPDTMPEAPGTGSNRKAQIPGLGNQAMAVASGNWQTPKASEEESGSGLNSRGEEKLKAQAQNWLTPHGMAGIDHTGKVGAGGEFAKQVERWQTPNAGLYSKRRQVGQTTREELLLPEQAAQWRTPDTNECGGAQDATKRLEGGHSLRLQDQAHSWPTPAARDHKGANSEEHAGGGKHMDQLSNFVAHSPQAQAIHGGQKSSIDSPGSRPPSFLTLMSELAHGNSLALCDVALLGKTGAPVVMPRESWLADLHRCLQKPRLNPAFGCWLMGWNSMWTNPAAISSARLEMESVHSKRLAHLRSLLEGSE